MVPGRWFLVEEKGKVQTKTGSRNPLIVNLRALHDIWLKCLAGVMGFGLSQEIFKETYQRPLIVNKETQAETKSRLRGHYIHWGLPGFHGSEYAAVGGV